MGSLLDQLGLTDHAKLAGLEDQASRRRPKVPVLNGVPTTGVTGPKITQQPSTFLHRPGIGEVQGDIGTWHSHVFGQMAVEGRWSGVGQHAGQQWVERATFLEPHPHKKLGLVATGEG